MRITHVRALFANLTTDYYGNNNVK